MIRFLHPEAFLLAPIVVAVAWRRARTTPAATVLRGLLLLALLGGVADPVADRDEPGRDLVLVVDRSRSVPASAAATVDELSDRAAREAGLGDRWGLVGFGRTATVLGVPTAGRTRAALPPPGDGDATDLAAGVDAGLAAIPPGRDGALLVVSDGEATGGDLDAAARRARRRGVRVDVVPIERPGTADVAVDDVVVPEQVAAGEPFQVAAWVRSDRPADVVVRLLRDGAVVAEGRRSLGAGVERVLFRDGIAAPGVHELAVEVIGAADRVPENDRARAVLRVEGRFRVLCVTPGGRDERGPGGYHRSPVADVLPVSLEMRQEQRKFALGMAVVLDRSGSMTAPAPGGPTKMDLANQGTCAALDLLTSLDAVAVIAVDSAPHVVVPLTRLTDRRAVQAEVLRIEAGGGGIFTATALKAAAEALSGASQGTRHIVLFADAADAEEPGDYATFVPALRRAGVTVSVIGLGSKGDADAAFLEDVARLGGGRCLFAAEAADLPRVFAQETIEVARSAVVTEPTAVGTLPDLVALGGLEGLAVPTVGGYTVGYLKPDARRGLVTKDELAAPFLAWWQRGLGRAVAFLGEADGPLSGGLATWDGYGDLFATVVRWAAGSEASDAVVGTSSRRGHLGRLVLEVEADREDLLAALDARVTGPDGVARPVDLVRTGPTRLEGTFPLAGVGVHRPAVAVGPGRFLRLAPLTLPYPPEFAPRADPREGRAVLARLAERTGGRVDPPSGTLYQGPRSSRAPASVVGPFVLAAVLLLVAEILVRRTGWTPSGAPLRRAAAAVAGFVRRRGARTRAASVPAAGDAAAAPAAGPARPGPGGPPPAAAPRGAPAADRPPTGRPAPASTPPAGIADVLRRARRGRRPPGDAGGPG